jgi:hypothetical protein
MYSHKIQILIQGIQPTVTVSELINYDINWWNVLLIEQLFPANLVELICNIIISPRAMQDRLVWAGTSTGQFTVQSAYHLEVDRQASSHGSSSARDSNTILWSLLWKLQIPRNVLLFLWRACNEILHTKENLCQRRIVEDPLCPMYGKEAESTIHAIWSCAATQTVWNGCPTRIYKCSVMEGGFLALFGSLSSRLEKEELELVGMVAQCIWF